jgi:hypothetical protein
MKRVIGDITADGKITPEEVDTLSVLAHDSTGATTSASPAIAELIQKHADAFTSTTALDRAKALVGVSGTPVARPNNDLVQYIGLPGYAVRNHALFIKKDGVIEGDTGTQIYSRGWGQFNAGVFENNHGSSVPASSIHGPADRARLTALSPGERLDAAVAASGQKLSYGDFSSIARGFTKPNEPDWAGVCYAWAWAALDNRLSTLVDVDGPAGSRGLWMRGQFLSRADLGNWLMGLLAGISQFAGESLWWAPEGEDLLKGVLTSLMDGGPGFRADIGNSYDRGDEVWFQPFVGGDVSFTSVPADVRDAILDVAAKPVTSTWGGVAPGVVGTQVKLVLVKGRYGNEQDDDHEDAPAMAEIEWALYAVLDGDGKLLKTMMADDPRLHFIAGLPVRESNPVPRTITIPDHSVIDGILDGTPNAEVQNSVYGPALNFFVGSVLARGVSAATRTAFEAEAALAGTGKISEAAQADLVLRYPTIANAYSPTEWQIHFADRGLGAAAFGVDTV